MTTEATIKVMPAYQVVELRSVDELRAIFANPLGKADEMNFALFSTSGTHGSYTTLEDVALSLATDDPEKLTVVVVQPRVIRMLYGHLEVSGDDLPFLRTLRETSAAVLRQYAEDC